MKEQGLRYNTGKLRYDLLHPLATEGIVKVLTKGAEKYLPKNWEKGMSWMSVVASLKRHLAAFEKGEDFDPETGLLHMDHVQCNAHFLSAYYKIAPQYDDRRHTTNTPLKIGLDIDELLCDWVGPWCKKFDLPKPTSWYFQREMLTHFQEMVAKGELNDFYANLPPLLSPADIPFEPHAYVTSRPVPSKVTEKWLDDNGFPTRPVYTVNVGESKANIIKEAGIDLYIDDRWENYIDLNSKGVLCYLWDAPHNQRYNAGFKRIKSLKELF